MLFEIGEEVFLEGRIVDSVPLQGDENNLCIEGDDGVQIWVVDTRLLAFGCVPNNAAVNASGDVVAPKPEPEELEPSANEAIESTADEPGAVAEPVPDATVVAPETATETEVEEATEETAEVSE